jgi:signal recognition particle receptor subunit alpha
VQLKRKSKAKVQRKWGDDTPTESDMAALDFSIDRPENATDASLQLKSLVDQDSLGTRTSDGMYEIKDWDFTKDKGDVDDVIADALKPLDSKTSNSEGTLGALGSFFARLTGSKVLTESDLIPVLEAMKQHLMKKNVAMEIADKVCEGVGESLVGKKLGSFQSTVSIIPLWFYILIRTHSHQQFSSGSIVYFFDEDTYPQDIYRSSPINTEQAKCSSHFESATNTIQHNLRRC